MVLRRPAWTVVPFLVVASNAATEEVWEVAAPSTCSGLQTQWSTCGAAKCPECQPVNCELGAWQDWQQSQDCSGLCTRRRVKQRENNECGAGCEGPLIDTKECPETYCKLVNRSCVLGDWQAWSNCSDPLSQSTRLRFVQVEPEGLGAACTDPIMETRPCSATDQVVNCEYSDWHDWTICTTTCDAGHTTRTRRVVTRPSYTGRVCQGPLWEESECFLSHCDTRDCSLSAWGDWTSCEAEDVKQRSRVRTVSPAVGGGAQCEGSLKETAACPAVAPTNCVLSTWSDWSQCDRTCDGGQRSRVRNVVAEATNGGTCSGGTLDEMESCNTKPCHTPGPEDCQLSTWGDWGACDGSCTMRRSRAVTKDSKPGGRGCHGAVSEVTECSSNVNCQPQDCVWGDWTTWSTCTKTCGGGSTSRSRDVQQPPRLGGKPCSPGDKQQVLPCKTHSCCVNGTWEDWTDWSPCSATCGSGYASRSRGHLQQPNFCGLPASGRTQEFKTCGLAEGVQPCPGDQDCTLSQWSDWSACSADCSATSCGCSTCFGVRQRFRTFKTFAIGSGKACGDASLEEVTHCYQGDKPPAQCVNTRNDTRDCEMTAWTTWAPCSATCGGGQTSRLRHILNPAVAGGKTCTGPSSEVQACGTKSCHKESKTCTPCSMGDWSSWSTCNTLQQSRNRAVRQTQCNSTSQAVQLCPSADIQETRNCSDGSQQTLYCSWGDWASFGSCNAGCGTGTMSRKRTLGVVRSQQLAGAYLFSFMVSSAVANATKKQVDGLNADTTKGNDNDETLSMCSDISQTEVALCTSKTACKMCEPKACQLSTWSDWSSANHSIAEGLCERTRMVAEANNECGEPCKGELIDTKSCPRGTEGQELPVACQLTSWSSWTQCTSAQGQSYRSRTVQRPPSHGGAPCEKLLRETRSCTTTQSVDCELSPWSPWTACSATCGSGTAQRTRSTATQAKGGGKPCDGPVKQLHECSKAACTVSTGSDCTFSDWTDWGLDVRSSQKTRTRSLVNIAGSARCEDSLIEVQPSRVPQPKDCELSPWASWGPCDRSCGGGGTTQRHRQVATYAQDGGTPCANNLALVQVGPCATSNRSCGGGELDCSAADWGLWSSCSASCGVGQRSRARRILQQRYDGAGCLLATNQTQACFANVTCSVDCKWSGWSDWGACSATCGIGEKTRSRDFAPAPTKGGQPCEPLVKQEMASCEQPITCAEARRQNCTNGTWGSWSDWSVCTTTCGGGVTWRTRNVAVAPSACGSPPNGLRRQVASCGESPCPNLKDCTFASWSDWGTCSKACFGLRVRNRSIASPATGFGTACVGSTSSVLSCNPGPFEDVPAACPGGKGIDCVIGQWTTWTTCGADCAQIRRSRVVEKPAEGEGKCGDYTLSEVAPCPLHNCTPQLVNCTWADWGDWGGCTQCSGQRQRFRGIAQHASHHGQQCDLADSEQTASCARVCHEPHYCSWGDWSAYSECSVTCGSSGRKSRTRALGIRPSSNGTAGKLEDEEIQRMDNLGISGAALQKQMEALQEEQRSVQVRRAAELVGAFSAGCVVLVAMLLAVRCASSQRTRSVSDPLRPGGFQPLASSSPRGS